MKVLITGADGMLGRTLQHELQGVEVIPTNHKTADITDAAAFDRCLALHKPDVVIHCAAMTAVDKCETEIDQAYRINAVGTENVASACYRHGAKLIAISTDYVFEGDSPVPYTEFDAPTGGHCVYGQSKWAAEQAVRTHCPNHIIARVSWLYGPGGPSFLDKMLSLADGTREVLKVVNDQRGNPTSTIAVAQALNELLRHPELVGTYHLTCEGEATWYDFACRIFELAYVNQKVIPCTSEEFRSPAKRPANSRLAKKKLEYTLNYKMPSWDTALADYLTRFYTK